MRMSISRATVLLSLSLSASTAALALPLALAGHRPLLARAAAFDTKNDQQKYLPAQIGGIVGAYGFSLLFVAAVLLLLAKRRREHLESGEDLPGYTAATPGYPAVLQLQDSVVPFAVHTPVHAHVHFSYPKSPPGPNLNLQAQHDLDPYHHHARHAGSIDLAQLSERELFAQSASYIPAASVSSALSVRIPGVDPCVDQEVVSADRIMAQAQLEEMYRHVMEHEEAKAAGVVLGPPSPLSPAGSASGSASGSAPGHRKDVSTSSTATGARLLRREKKPTALSLEGDDAHEKKSRASSLLSALKSPRKKKMQGLQISSPIMTPLTGTFAPMARDGEELSMIPPRHYAPPAPPPVPVPVPSAMRGAGPTPETSPLSTLSIDERIGATYTHERDPDSAVSAQSGDSAAPLVGLPSSPRMGRFSTASGASGASGPSLPASPRGFFSGPRSPGLASHPPLSFSRPHAPSAVRTGGALPLRAYEPSLSSPSFASQTTKQTVFERSQPLSPGAAPWTGAPVPYSPYQPFSPVVPITPSLVTKADRKRMRRLEPKTPTMEMVRSTDETW